MSEVKSEQNLSAVLMKGGSEFLSMLKIGDLVSGKILEKGSRTLLVDLGKHGVGAVYRGELQNAKEMVKALHVGDEIHAKVISIDNEDGYVELSVSEAGKQKAWGEVAEIRDREDIIKLKITASNKGGLMGELCGLPAFLPVSQLGNDNYPKANPEDRVKLAEELAKLVEKEIEVRVIDVNPRSNKLIVSERAAGEVSMKELAKNYSVGQEIEGLVSGVADFGVFLKFTDNPVVEGFIHVSELDYRIIENPKEVVKIDDVIKAKIVDIKDGKISLSLKALKEDPWKGVEKKYKEGEEVTGTVYSFHPYGVIVNLDSLIQGQVHVSDFGGTEEMKKTVSIGKEYTFKIESVKPEERKITLKLIK